MGYHPYFAAKPLDCSRDDRGDRIASEQRRSGSSRAGNPLTYRYSPSLLPRRNRRWLARLFDPARKWEADARSRSMDPKELARRDGQERRCDFDPLARLDPRGMVWPGCAGDAAALPPLQ